MARPPLLFVGGPADGTVRAVEAEAWRVLVMELSDAAWGPDVDLEAPLVMPVQHAYTRQRVILHTDGPMLTVMLCEGVAPDDRAFAAVLAHLVRLAGLG